MLELKKVLDFVLEKEPNKEDPVIEVKEKKNII